MTAVEANTGRQVIASERKGSRWAPLSGVLFAAILVPAVLLTSGIPQAQDAAKVQAWAVKHTGLFNASFLANSIGVIVGLCFLIWLHSILSRDEGGWAGNLFLVGVAIFAVSGTVAAGLDAILGTDAKHLSTDSVQLMASFMQNFNYPFLVAGLAVMYLGAGLLIRRTGLLPSWLAWVSFVFAALATTVYLGFIPLLGTVLWLIAVSVILAARRPAER